MDQLLTIETVQTLAAQVVLIGLLTEVLKRMAGWTGRPDRDGAVQGIALGTGVVLQLLFNVDHAAALAGLPAMGQHYGLAVLNGLIVATAPMKAAEWIKRALAPAPSGKIVGPPKRW